uniref:KP-Fur-10 n=1 Tax=Furina ornata TaxID=529697 RepID=R4G2V5_9SAUR
MRPPSEFHHVFWRSSSPARTPHPLGGADPRLQQGPVQSYCELPADRGPCKSYSEAFYYSPVYHKCLRFMYGGCPGNANNFKTIDECQRTCAA